MTELLALAGARLVHAGTTGEPLDAAGGERRLVLAGNFHRLFRFLDARAELAAGTVLFAGSPARESIRNGSTGFAPLDPPFVEDWTVERYLVESGRLAHLSAADATSAAAAALERFGIGGLARTRIRHLFVPVRRALVLAGATLTGPAVLCAEAPLSGLDPESQNYVFYALERAANERALIVSVPTLLPAGAERALLERADWVVVEHAGRIVRQGSPAETFPAHTACVATVARGGSAFIAALGERGFTVRPAAVSPVAPARGAEAVADAPLRVIVELDGSISLDHVLVAAHSANTPLIELYSV